MHSTLKVYGIRLNLPSMRREGVTPPLPCTSFAEDAEVLELFTRRICIHHVILIGVVGRGFVPCEREKFRQKLIILAEASSSSVRGILLVKRYRTTAQVEISNSKLRCGISC
uniref:Uncharacterized protein n=1 Tax=Physcomitrium patens TaxID=3218 RepID=A0A2K1KNE2_PHYPA|nr:hypothetical protein PHYPA_006195 [Physcomitrium patens]